MVRFDLNDPEDVRTMWEELRARMEEGWEMENGMDVSDNTDIVWIN